MCGIAVAGKTTVALDLERAGFTRLSIDEEVWTRFGRYGVDYPPGRYPDLQARALDAIEHRLKVLLATRTPVVLALSFGDRDERQRFRELVGRSGGTSQVVYLKAAPDLLRRRLEERSTRFDANAAFPSRRRSLIGSFATSRRPPARGRLSSRSMTADGK
jgi:predicted kinase